MSTNKKRAKIRKEIISLITYPFFDPSPIPQFGRLYPYNRFDGYTRVGYEHDWEMVVMENDHIKLWVNPAVGGKIWGAIEKATNKAFIYFNHAVKFRDVAMRGPWTSGGIEFNTGIVGHSPSCSAVVDHFMRENNDGSVSCFISATDWPSRTTWTVEINLPADAAYFITRSQWHNDSGLDQACYQWSNAGVKTAGNLEYINAGHQWLGHDGRGFAWPVDAEGRQLSFYNNNNFVEYRSYHVFGTYSNFWGCYWHDDNFGLGHYSPYDERPGRKIWIWGLSRYGMIWEDLLTDHNGQYTELQSGGLFTQSIATSVNTPFKHCSLSPYSSELSTEHWFAVKNIDGLTCGNPLFSFSVSKKNGNGYLNLCANQNLDVDIRVEYDHQIKLLHHLALNTLETVSIALPGFLDNGQLKLWADDELIYSEEEQNKQLARPSTMPDAFDPDSVQGLYIQAKDWEKQRFNERAVKTYEQCLQKDPFFIGALTGLAGLFIKQVLYKQAFDLLTTALSINTYDAEANYLFGMVNIRLNKVADARDAFSIASQSPAYRSAAYTELAKVFLRENQLQKALTYVEKALMYNTPNRHARILEMLINRMRQNKTAAIELAIKQLESNPLDHLANFELYRAGSATAADVQKNITGEMQHETFIELSLFYFNLELYDECRAVLALAPGHPMVYIWKAYTSHWQRSVSNANGYIDAAISFPVDMVFPHREEDVAALEWATTNYRSWRLKYYLALVYIQLSRRDEALNLLLSCGNEPDHYVFYLLLADLQRKTDQIACETNLRKAGSIDPKQWRPALLLAQHFGAQNRWGKALSVAQRAFEQHPGHSGLGIYLARCYMQTNASEAGITLMKKLNVLPNEGASDGRIIWRETHLGAALKAIENKEWNKALTYIVEARQWPEHMGVGKPYEVDERVESFLELCCLERSNQDVPDDLVNNIATYRDKPATSPYNSNDFLSIYILLQRGDMERANGQLKLWQDTNPDDIALKWSLAFIEGDEELLNELSQIEPEMREPLPYEILFVDRSFPFIKTMQQMGLISSMNHTLSRSS